MGEVHQFVSPPKRYERHYKQQKYVLTFLPPTKLWKWEVVWVNITKFDGEAKTMNAAQKAAEKHIDQTIATRGGK